MSAAIEWILFILLAQKEQGYFEEFSEHFESW